MSRHIRRRPAATTTAKPATCKRSGWLPKSPAHTAFFRKINSLPFRHNLFHLFNELKLDMFGPARAMAHH